MASFTRGLGLVLTACMVATRSSSAIRAGSPDSSRWWETKDFIELIRTAQERRAARDFAGLESVYVEGCRRAEVLGNAHARISYLNNLATVRMISMKFPAALEAYLQASKLAEETGDSVAMGGIAINLAVIYQRVGDTEAALSALERGKAAVDRIDQMDGGRTLPPYMPQLLMRLRSVRAALQNDPAHALSIEPRYEDAIEAARQTGDANAEASAWHLLGEEKMAAGKLEEAEADLGKALRLRRLHAPENLEFSYAMLGALRMAQADHATGRERLRLVKEAGAFTEQAIRVDPTGPANYTFVHQRGQIREVLGQTEVALDDFRQAVDQASRWSGAVPPALSLMIGANVAIQKATFDSFVEAAARKALRTGNKKWMTDAFLALEANRAASLRESRELAPVWKKKLPEAYWETLARLNENTARDLSTGGTVSIESRHLLLVLTEMESTAGVGVSVRLVENFRTQSSLTDIQHGLGESDLLLSFYLGKQESYLWAVTRRSLKIYRLPKESEVREAVKQFQEAIVSGVSVSGGPPAGEKLGADLYQRLFGALDPAEAAKTSWLLSLDGALFDLPFAALVRDTQNGRAVYAAEHHSSQRIPGAFFLKQSLSSTNSEIGGYLGVADAVYNSADPRWTPEPKWTISFHPGPPKTSDDKLMG